MESQGEYVQSLHKFRHEQHVQKIYDDIDTDCVKTMATKSLNSHKCYIGIDIRVCELNRANIHKQIV